MLCPSTVYYNILCVSPEDQGVGAAEAEDQSLRQLNALCPHQGSQLLQEPGHGRAADGLGGAGPNTGHMTGAAPQKYPKHFVVKSCFFITLEKKKPQAHICNGVRLVGTLPGTSLGLKVPIPFRSSRGWGVSEFAPHSNRRQWGRVLQRFTR